VNGFFSNKEMSKSKKRIINVTFVIQILSAILSGLVGFGILLNFGLFISETEQTQPLPNLIMAILMAIIAPLNLIMAFVLKKVSNSINKNYKTSIEDSFAVER
jgi:divalent metal cation (Fe/Co/Zn/Cd) transporter